MIDVIGMKLHAETADSTTRTRLFERAKTLRYDGDKYFWDYNGYRFVVDPPDIFGKYRAWCFTGEKIVDVPNCGNVWDAMIEIERMV